PQRAALDAERIAELAPHRQALLVEAARLGELAALESDVAEVVERHRGAAAIADAALDREALLEQRHRALRLALVEEKAAEVVEQLCERLLGAFGALQGERLLEQRDRFGGVADLERDEAQALERRRLAGTVALAAPDLETATVEVARCGVVGLPVGEDAGTAQRARHQLVV